MIASSYTVGQGTVRLPAAFVDKIMGGAWKMFVLPHLPSGRGASLLLNWIHVGVQQGHFGRIGACAVRPHQALAALGAWEEPGSLGCLPSPCRPSHRPAL